MKKDVRFSSKMLALAGGLMTVSGILMAVCGRLAIGGMLWAAASCLFFAAYHVRLAGNQTENVEDGNDEQEIV